MGPTGVRPEGGPLSQENAGQRPRGPRCPSRHPAGPGALSPCRHQHWPGLGAAKPQEEAGPSPESAHPRLLCSAQRQCRPLGGVSGLWERGQSVAVAAGSPSRYGPHITELWGDSGRLAPHPAARARRSPCGEAVWAHSLTPRTAAGTPRPWHALQAGTRPLLAASREGPFPFWGYWGFITLPTRFTGPLSCFEALLVPAAWQALPIPPDGRPPAVPQG